jgi:hypothetical protein
MTVHTGKVTVHTGKLTVHTAKLTVHTGNMTVHTGNMTVHTGIVGKPRHSPQKSYHKIRLRRPQKGRSKNMI